MKSVLRTVVICSLLSSLLFTTCDNEIVGLGKKVVTLAPTIDTKGKSSNPNSKQPGDFLYGEENLIHIDAQTEGTLKYVKVTYEWEENGDTISKVVHAEQDENKNWIANIDTTDIPDGAITARIEAADTADRVTTSTPITYIVKNNPPFVNMLIPNVGTNNYDKVTQYKSKEFDNKPSHLLPSVVMDSYISGVFDDLAGIAPGYPMIKLWKEGSEEPGTHGMTDRNNAGYGDVTALNKEPNDGWINVDDGLVKSEKGAQAGSFKYFLREHKRDGSWYDQGDGKAIGVGDYRLKILIKDLTGKIIEWPKDAYKWPEGTPDSARCMKLKIVDNDLPPQVAITDPEAMYLREDFNVKAEAKAPGERYLAEMYVKVEGKKISSEGKVLLVTLDKKVIPAGKNLLKDEIETKNKIEIGKTYYSMKDGEVAIKVDSEFEVPSDAHSFISFVDGSYNFVVTALSESGSEGKDLKTIYIDQTPPKTEITRVSRKILDYRPDTVTPSLIAEDKPFGFTAEKAKITDYRRLTVNSTVAIDVSTTDNRGNAIDKDNYIKFKYILLKDKDIAISALENIIDGDKLKEQEFSEYLYSRDDAEFFEKTVRYPIPSSPNNGNPLLKVTGKDGAYTLTLQTRLYDERQKYKLWLYVVALDNAGNAGFNKILLNVDQDTDKPDITFGNINAEGSSNGLTFMDGKYGIRFDVKDDNGLDGASSVQVRYAKNKANMESLNGNAGWFTLPGTITEDKLSIYIDNLKLIEIALRMNGNNYSGNEDLEQYKALLGNENDTKYIQVRATDSIYGKIYETDGTYAETTEWRPFRIDLTIPEIQISTTDNNGKQITRDEQNPFIAPVKEGSYTKTTDFTAYGDIVEQNISKIEVKIDGKTARNYNVPDPDYSASTPGGNDIAVWKTKNSGWDGELRFRIPFSSDEFFTAGTPLYLQDGSHTYEINIYDKAGQYATQTITFYIDTRGPDIDVIIPSGNIYLKDINNITQTERDKLLANSIKDANAKLIGSFKDSYSPVFSSDNNQYWYAINSSAWISAGIPTANITDSKSVTWQIDIPDSHTDGIYTLSMRVKDSLGNGYDSSKPITSDDTGGYLNNIAYMLDRNIPQLKDIQIYSEAKQGQGSGFTVKGTVSDTYNISKFDITVKENSKNKVGTHTQSGKEKEFTFEYWVRTDEDKDFEYGSNNVTISVTGSSGKSAIKTVNFILDDRGPEISFNTTGGNKIIMDGAQVDTINGANISAPAWNNYLASLYETRIKDRSASAKLSGRFSDDYNAISDKDGKFTFWYRIDGPGNVTNGTWKSLPMTATANSKSVPWEITIPEPNVMADGIYRLTIGVSDVIGNGYNGSSVPAPVDGITYGYEKNMAFMVDRSAPTLNMGKIEGAVFDGNTNINFTGSISGTYKVESLSMIVNSGTDQEKTIELKSPATGAKTFTITPEIINTAALNHGRQNIVISVKGSSDQTKNETVSFIVDKEGPDVTISGKSKIYEGSIGNTAVNLTTNLNNGSINPRNWNGDLAKIYGERLKDDSAKLTLNISDEFSALNTSLKYKINGGTEQSITISNPEKNASLDIPWSVYSTVKEGLNTLDITVSDKWSNETKEQNIVFMVDRKVPVLEVSGIKSNDVFSGKTNIPITGKVTGVYDVTRLSLVFNGEELSVQGTEEGPGKYLTYENGGFPFVFAIPSSEFTGKHGTYTVLVNAVGSSGQSKMENYSIIIDQKGPSIDVNIPSGAKNYGANIPVTALLANSVKETPAQLSGSFNDEYSPVFSSAYKEYWYKISGAGGNVTWTKMEGTITNSKSAPWQVTVPDNFPDGVYTLSLRVKDSWGNGYSTTDSPSDNSGEGYINDLAFLLDRSAPALTFEPVSLTTKNGETGFYVVGTVKDTYKINSINIKIGDNSKNETILTQGSDRNFTFNHWVKTEGDNLVYGSNIVTISVTGSSGQSSVATQNLIIDNRGPEISFNTTGGEKLNDLTGSVLNTLNTESLANAAWTTKYKEFLYETRIKDKSASAKLSGRFSDDYTNITASDGKYDFWYRIDGPGNVTNGSWASITMTTTANSKSVPWDIPISVSMEDGIYRLSVAVRDGLNNGYYYNGNTIIPAPVNGINYGYEANMAFMIDRKAPAINITKITTGEVFGKNTDVKFEGTVTNTYEVQKLIMSFGETTRELTIPASSGTKTFTINTTTLNTKDLTDDGKQNIIFTATGSSDQTVSKTISIIYDKIGPEVEISGKTKILKGSLESTLGANAIAILNAGLGSGSENPRNWASDFNLKYIYNDRLKDDSAKLTLNIKDAYSNLKTFAYKINDATETWKSLSISTNSKDASVEIPWSALGSGLNTLDIRVSDDLDNEAKDIGIVFMVDKNSPTIYGVDGIGDNQAYSGSKNITLTGKVTGVYDVTRLSLIFDKAELEEQTRGTELGAGKYLNYADGGFPFNFTIPTSGLYGPYSVLITAVGSSGKSESLTYNIIIDNKGPNVTFNVPSNKITMTDAEKNSFNTALNSGSLTGAQQTIYNSLKTTLITDTSTKLSGTFNDEYSAVANNDNKTFWWQIDGGTWTPVNLPVSDNKSVGWEVPIGTLDDGVHLLSLRAKDKWGNGSNDTALGNGGYENNIAFMIDRSQPKFKTLSVPEAALKTQFDVSGTIENTYGIKRLSIKLGNDEIAVIEDALTTEENITYNKGGSALTVTGGAGKTFNFTAKIDPSLVVLEDGPVSLTFTAIGSSGQVAIGVKNFILDKTGPAITIGAPISEIVCLTDTDLTSLKDAVNTGNFSGISANTILNSDYDKIYKTRVKDSSASFTITFTDDKSPVFSAEKNIYWYSFDGQSFVSKQIDSTEYGKKSVSIKLPLPKETQTDGVHSLSIRVIDSLGNGYDSNHTISEPGVKDGYVNKLVFMIDSGTPKLTFNIDSPATINAQGLLTLSGNITDTFEVQELSVKIGSTIVASKAGEGGTFITVNGTNNKKMYNFTGVNINNSAIKTATGGNEGSYTISVTVKGSSDQSEMKVSTFVLDTNGPVISINSPIKEKIYLKGTQLGDINSAILINDIDSLKNNPFEAGITLKDKYYDLLKYNVKDTSAGLSGSFADTYSDVGIKYWYKFNNGSWMEGDTIFTNIGNKKSADWQIPLTGLTDGLNQLSLRVQDELSNGYYKNTNPDGDNGNGYENNITFILDTAAPDFSDDIAGLTEGEVKGISPDHFTVSGKIFGTFMVKRLSVSLIAPAATVIETGTDGKTTILTANSDPWIRNIKLTPENGQGKAYSYSFDVYTLSNNNPLPYGSRSITISAIGSSDQSALKILPFIFDNKGPTITVNTPITSKVYLSKEDLNTINNTAVLPAGALKDKYDQLVKMGVKDASAGLNGYFNDEHSEIGDTFWYKFLDDVPDSGWKAVPIANSEKSVAWTIPLTDPIDGKKFREDGIYRVSIRTKDKLGNGYDNNSNPAGSTGPGYENELAFIIDMGIPKFTNFKLERNGTEYDTNIFFNGNFNIIGTIENTVSITRLSARIGGNEIAVAGADVTSPTPGVVITKVVGEDKKFTFVIPVNPKALNLGEKAHSVSVTATGSSGQSSIETSNFTYDVTAPTVSFNSPVAGTRKVSGDLSNGKYSIWWSGSWETGEIKIGGVADDQYGVDKIYYRIGKMGDNFADAANDGARETLYSDNKWWTDTSLDVTTPAPKWSGGLYYWNYLDNLNPYLFSPSLIERNVDPTAGDTENTFYLPFYVKVVDRAGNINVVHYKVYVDPDKDIPGTKIVSPTDGVMVGGEIRITGTANDNNWVHSVDIRIIDTTKTEGSPGYYYISPGDEWFDKANGWIKAKIAGNTDTTVSWYYSVNSDGLLNPEPGKTGRPVQIQVRAWDTKDMVYHDKPDLVSKPSIANYTFDSGVPTISIPKIIKDGNPDRNYVDSIRVSGVFKVKADVQDDGGISSIRARLTGNSAFTEIVKDGVVTSDLKPGWNVVPPANEPQNNWVQGWRYYITNLGTGMNWDEIDLDHLPGKTYQKGTMIKYNGATKKGTGATAMKANGGTQANSTDNKDSANWNSQYFKYTVEFEINSISSFAYGKTGIFTVELDVYDNNKEPAPYSTRGTYNLGVDNYYPTAVITTQFNATTSKFYVMGSAKDFDEQSGSQQGLARVLVYFSRGTGTNLKYYNARGIAFGTGDNHYNSSYYAGTNWATGVGSATYKDVRDMTKEPAAGDYAPNGNFTNSFPVLKEINNAFGNVWESPHAMVIDRQELGETTDTDKDGTYAEQWEGRAEILWQARLDTTVLTAKIGDGPLTVHYVIMDEAGNATHYADDIYIGNNRPLIRSINLGTDINGDGNVTDWTSNTSFGEYLKNSITIGDAPENNVEQRTDFRVRNSRFRLRLDALYGNIQKHYRVSYVTRDKLVKSTEMVRGKVYTIASDTETSAAGLGTVGEGNTEWTKYGALSKNPGTTFVASGEARDKNDQGNSTTGYAWQYKDYSDTATFKTGDFKLNSALGTDAETDGKLKYSDFVYTGIFNAADFASAIMGDSAGKTYNSDGNMILLHDKRFIVKVYDTTVSGQGEDQQLAHVALLNVDFDNKDGSSPIALINPFHWTSEGDNSLYGNSKDNGHIELGATPKVSGQISVRGTASDNNIIKSLWANVQGLNLTGAADTTTIGGTTYYRIANYTPAGGLVGDNANWNNNGWKCTIIEPENDQNGHRVKYQLDIDTSKHTNVAATSQSLRIFARDFSDKDQAVSGTSTTAAARTSMYTMDIVPYISNIITKLTDAYGPNPSAFSRSALGWYPVREDEIIEIEGFNLLEKGANKPTVQIRPEANSANGTTGVRALHTDAGTTGFGTHTVNKVYARVDNDQNNGGGNNTITSGYLVVRVNNIDSINNTNSEAEYNKEGNGLNNDILTDDRALYVWTTGSMMPSGEPMSTIYNPFMRMDQNGTRYMSYGYYPQQSNGRLKVMRNNTSYAAGGGFSNRIINTTVGIGNTNASWYAMGSDQSSAINNNRGFQFGMSLSNGTGSTFGYTTSTASAPTPTGNNYIIVVPYLANSNNARFKIPRVAVQPTGSGNRSSTNADRVLISYFDDEQKVIKLIYGNTGDTTAGSGTGAGSSTVQNISGTPQRVATSGTKYRSSQYTAVGFLKNGLPVVAWYDGTNRNLIFSWGASAPTTTPATTSSTGSYVMTPTDNSGTFYTQNNHGLVQGSMVVVGTNRYYVQDVVGNDFSLNASINDAVGTNLGNSINIIKAAGPPTTVANNANNVADTWMFTFPNGHGLTDGQTVNIVIGDNAPISMFARVYQNSTTNVKFSPAANTTAGGDFLGGNNTSSLVYNGAPLDHTRMYVYRTGATTSSATVRAGGIGGSSWQSNAVIIDNFKGTHVDLAVDDANNVHLAYYDVSNGGLYYALIPADGTGNGSTVRPQITRDAKNKASNITPVRVDTYLSAGTKIMINVRKEGSNYVPYITYAHASFSETENSVRVAWRKDFTTVAPPAGSDDSDAFTGKWEVMTVPTNQVPNTNEFICNGVPTVNATGANGWENPSGTDPLVKSTTQDLSKTILVGYLTENWYEGAILKKDLWK
jgi:hypothetical protein